MHLAICISLLMTCSLVVLSCLTQTRDPKKTPTMRGHLSLLGLSLFLALAGTRPALALNLDGTAWVGTRSCSGLLNGRPIKFKLGTGADPTTIAISQTGSDATVTWIWDPLSPVGSWIYDAVVQDDLKQPFTKGGLGIVFDGTDSEASTYGEMSWGKVKYNPDTGKGSFTLKGTRISDQRLETCTWRFKTQ